MLDMKSKKLILDTNLWISFLISKKFDLIDNLILTEDFQLIFSKELLEEFTTVAQRGKFKKYFDNNDIIKLLKLFDIYGKIIEVSSKIEICRDYKDNFLLSLAIDSNSDYLLTGDSDLLILKKIGKTKIITWNNFLKRYFKN